MTEVVAHRGASAREPENSLAAFRLALDLGADAVELDVHATADGRIVVHHDPTIGGRPIAETPFDDVRQTTLPNGEPVPTLDDALDVLGDGVTVYVEVKALSAVHDDSLLAVLDAGPAPHHAHVHSFDHRIVRRLRDARPDLVIGILSASYPVDPLIQLERSGAGELWQEQSLVDGELVTGVHRKGARIIAWTADDPDRIRALHELGVDGICSNTPDVVRRIVG